MCKSKTMYVVKCREKINYSKYFLPRNRRILLAGTFSGNLVFHRQYSIGWYIENQVSYPSVPSHFFVVVVVGGLRISVTRIAIMAGVFILLVGPPKSDR